jgi:CRP-like cAMP-binding protein
MRLEALEIFSQSAFPAGFASRFPFTRLPRTLCVVVPRFPMLTPFQSRAKRALAASPLFGAIADESMRWVQRSSVRKGALLYEKGDPGERLFAVVGGQLKLIAEDASGRCISFGLIARGELVGEVDFSTGAPRHASALALANCELATLHRRDLEPVFERQPELRSELSLAAAQAALRLSQRIEDAAFLSIEDRVAKALDDCARRFGEVVDGGTRIRVRQQDLADVLGLSRETVSKVLTSPAMHGRLELGRGRIDLLRA